MELFKGFNRKRKERAEQIAALQRLFNQDTIDGQNALKYILSITHIQDSSWDEDINRTNFNEGERNVGLQIIQALNMPIHKVLEIINQQESEQD